MPIVNNHMRISELKEKFIEIYNYIEEYRLIKAEMEERIIQLETKILILDSKVTFLENQ